MIASEIDSAECYYFGVWGQPGHYTWNRNRQGVNPSQRIGEVPTFLDPRNLDGRFCRNPGAARVGDEQEGLAFLRVVEVQEGKPEDAPLVGSKWTVLGFNDRSGDERSGSNSAFIARGIFSFSDMIAIAQVQFPSIWSRITEKFEITDIRTVR